MLKKNLLENVRTFFCEIGCDDAEVRNFFTANLFSGGIVMPLAAVCIIPGNKPAGSKSKQTHIHVTSKACEFFYPAKEIDEADESTPWIRQNLKMSLTNVQVLHGESRSSHLSLADTYMMTKIECRKEQLKQVQLSKLTADDSLFLKLRRGLYKDDVLIFLKYRNEDRYFVLGIPHSYFNSIFLPEGTGRTARLKVEIYETLESEHAIPVKTAIKNVLLEHESDGVIESEEPISDAIYQSMVDSAVATKTQYIPEEYVAQNPDGSSTKSYRPPTNPAIGKEAIQDSGYRCAINSAHETFLKPDGTKYMEVHHLVPLNQQKNFKYKLDTKANIVPLCPNCHRMLHHARFDEIEALLEELFEKRNDALERSGINIGCDKLLSYYK